MGLARHLAHRYRGGDESLDDLMQVACIGLIKAADRFEPARGVAFGSYAAPYILGELRRHFRDRSWALRVPRPIKELALRLRAATEQLTREYGRDPTVAELALALGTTSEAVLEARTAAEAHRTSSFDWFGGDEHGEGGAGPGDLDDGFRLAEHRATLAALLSVLSERDRTVLRLRYAEDLTQSEIAARLGMSQMQVSRRLSRSLARLQELGAAAA